VEKEGLWENKNRGGVGFYPNQWGVRFGRENRLTYIKNNHSYIRDVIRRKGT